MIDTDHFKPYNDQYGHQAGDRVLAAIARCLAEHASKARAIAARYGGEEFAVLVPEASLHETFRIAEDIRKAVASLGNGFSAGPVPTVSIGISSVVPKLEDEPQDLIASADRALYEAKHKGRNRTVSEQVSFIGTSKGQAA